MGVPAFFRWLTKKYPSVIVDAVEDKPKDADGNRVPVDTRGPNPNFQVLQSFISVQKFQQIFLIVIFQNLISNHCDCCRNLTTFTWI